MSHECSCHGGSTARSGGGAPAGERTVAEVAERVPGAREALARLGVDQCCGAHLTLSQAAASAGVRLEALLAALGVAEGMPA